MKNIIVFGASGGTGLEVVEQALEAGHHVTVLLRHPDKFSIRHEQLRVIQGDVLQPQTYENLFFGVDVVISCLGTRNREPTTVYSVGMMNILTGMQKVDVTRIICLSAGAVVVPPNATFVMKFVIKYILQRLFKYSYADMLKMETVLKHSELNWTVIRPPRLLNGDKTGIYRTIINDYLPNMSSLKRADLAHYIIHHLDDEKTFKNRVEISY
jgi:putative NADH-flavin reductase